MPASRRFTEVAAALAVAAFLLSWGLVHTGWYDDHEIVDIPVYEKYGSAIESGAVPYRDIEPEYPPGALPAFAVPALLSHDLRDFRDAFEWLMAACGAVAVLLAAVSLAALRASRARTVAALALATGFPLLLGSVVLTRFDLYPAALVAGALAALVHRRDRLGLGLLGAAVAVKLYPAVLLPVAAAYVWQRRGRREALICLGLAAAVVAAVFLPFLVVAPDGVAHSIGRQLSRPLQIESLGAALYLAAHHLLGIHVEMRSGHGSQNLFGAGTTFAAVLLSLMQLGALVWIWSRRPRSADELVRWSAAALVAFVALGKVLSPQFLIWLAPIVPLVAGLRGLRASGLLAAGLVLTQLWFPSRYWELARELDPLASSLVLARDFVLVALLVVLVRGSRPEPAQSP
ncbi:MAG TPA: glycosyltransferase 87 family protein [Gaiellaceae bacterium]|nr:glycosyltransferase 87 family protein [Gaiellaceae bacterium]